MSSATSSTITKNMRWDVLIIKFCHFLLYFEILVYYPSPSTKIVEYGLHFISRVHTSYSNIYDQPDFYIIINYSRIRNFQLLILASFVVWIENQLKMYQYITILDLNLEQHDFRIYTRKMSCKQPFLVRSRFFKTFENSK